MAIKGICWLKGITWGDDALSMNLKVGFISIDETQVETDFVMQYVAPTVDRATIEAATREVLINDFSQTFEIGDVVRMMPPEL